MGEVIGYSKVLRNASGDAIGIIGVHYKFDIMTNLISPLVNTNEEVTYFIYEVSQ